MTNVKVTLCLRRDLRDDRSLVHPCGGPLRLPITVGARGRASGWAKGQALQWAASSAQAGLGFWSVSPYGGLDGSLTTMRSPLDWLWAARPAGCPQDLSPVALQAAQWPVVVVFSWGFLVFCAARFLRCSRSSRLWKIIGPSYI